MTDVGPDPSAADRAAERFAAPMPVRLNEDADRAAEARAEYDSLRQEAADLRAEHAVNGDPDYLDRAEALEEEAAETMYDAGIWARP